MARLCGHARSARERLPSSIVYDPKRTQVAQSLVDFGRYFDTIFARTRIGATVPMRPVLVVPDDMSTGGGRRARQSITLQPEVPGPASLTCGWIDIPSRQAMIRTWGCLAAMHRQRFAGRPFDVDQASYDLFLKQTQELLKTCGLTTQIEDQPGDAPSPLSRASLADVETTIATVKAPTDRLLLWAVAMASFFFGAVLGGAAVWYRLRGF
jgi:hypothetical protein